MEEAVAPDSLSWVEETEALEPVEEAPDALSWGLSRLGELSSKSMNGKTSTNQQNYKTVRNS